MNKRLEDAINEQLNFEIESAHVYLAMQGYIATLGLPGFENWLAVQYQEELAHSTKFMKYINERGGRVLIKGFEDPRTDYKSVLEVFEVALNHEFEVTARINNIMKIAHEESDYATISFMGWFVDEQVEEEDNFSTLIDKIKLVKDAGLYMLDKELATRVFVDPNQA
ncbi:putative ferritin-1 [Candidatus Izimaplasma bacterium HR1]|jgi:ferritin|nr:putative ferritin-1 [Candidatus Izimaplasma bacterium HR1]